MLSPCNVHRDAIFGGQTVICGGSKFLGDDSRIQNALIVLKSLVFLAMHITICGVRPFPFLGVASFGVILGFLGHGFAGLFLFLFFLLLLFSLLQTAKCCFLARLARIQLSHLQEMLAQMLQVMRGTTDLLPDVVTFSALVAGSTWQRGLHVLDVTLG